MADENNPTELATALTIAWLENANTRAGANDVPQFLAAMHSAVLALNEPEPPVATSPKRAPAVSVRKSLASPDHIVSLIDGKPYRALRRHLRSHGLTPEQYRDEFGLKADYPMVSETYSTARREMAKSLGLGRKPGLKVEKKLPAAKGPRKAIGAALAAAKDALGTSG